MPRRRHLAIVLPAVLLLTVASIQMVLARTADLSPWKGGGFGMFASVDGLPFRWARVFVFAPQRSEEIAIPPSLEDEANRAVTWPYRRAMARLARATVERERRNGRPVEAVRVEIWRADVTGALDVSEALMRDVTFTVHELDRAHDR